MSEDLFERQIQAEIVSIGTELLLGEITDTNASWLAGRLPAIGIPVYRIQQVGDNRQRLISTLRSAWERANLLIVTGGLGPTEDDLTRESIAELLGEDMVVVPELERELRAFFARRGRAMPARNVKQATVIPSARILENPIGTAPGWWVAHKGRYIVAMPGVPVEMRRMWQEQAIPRLLKLPRGGVIVSRTLKVLGIGESAVEEQLGELVRSVNPTVATYAKNDGIHVRIAARAQDASQAAGDIEAMERSVRELFGARIYGVDDESLSSATARLIESRGLTVAIGEAGSGGAVCAALAGPTFAGAVVNPPLAAYLDAAATELAAVELARQSRDRVNAKVGLALAVSPQSEMNVRLSAAVVVGSTQVTRTEDQTIDQSDLGRRAQLLSIQVLRDTLLEV